MSSTLKSVPFPSRRNLSLSLAAAVALVLGSQGAQAASLTWDANTETTGVQDGGGIWNTTNNNWWNGTTNVVWDTSTVNSVTFGGGTAGTPTVTLASDLTVGNITFLPPSSGIATYTIAGSNTLTLSNTVIGGAAAATISANLTGTTGLTVTNTGGITLSGTNTYSGATIVGSGTSTAGAAAVLRVGDVGALGNSTDIRVGNGAALVIAVPNSTSTLAGSGKTLNIFGAGPGSNGALQGASGVNTTWAGNVVLNVGLPNTTARISGGSNGTLTISGVISEATKGSGVVFNRIGGSTTVLNAVNTYTGDTTLFNNAPGTTSTLRIGVDNAINANSRLITLVADGTATSVLDLNGHVQALRGLDTTSSPNPTSSANLIVRNNGSVGSTLTVGDASATATFGGVIQDGTGGMSLVKSGANTQILVGANTYTGSTTVNDGTVQIGKASAAHFTGANGSLASTDIRLNNGSFVIDNTGTNNNSSIRLSDSANVTLNGGTSFIYKGSELAGSQETLGKFTFASGMSTINLVHGTNNTAVVTAGELSRSIGGGIGFISGADFGSTAAAASRLIATNSSAVLVGTSEALATGVGTAKDTKIVPFLLASSSNSSTPDTFVTYNSTTGMRPLSLTDEFESNIVSGANVRITADAASTGTNTINSLILAAPTDKTFTINSGQTLTNTSGAILFTATNTINGGTLDFGDEEGIVTVNSGKIGIIGSTKITGSNGLSFFSNGTGTLALGSSESTYTGNTTLYSGVVVPQTSSKGSGETLTGPFGRSTVVFAGSQIRTSSGAQAPVTIGNPVRLQADTTLAANTSGGNHLIFSGAVTLAGTRTLTNSTTWNTTFSGAIDGGQGDGLTLSGTGTGSVILSGNNSYTGPTMVRSSTLNVSGSIASSSALAVQNSGSFILSGNNPAGFDRIGDNAPVTLGGGTGNSAMFKVDNSTASASFEESVGTLTLLSNSILDLGTGGSGTYLHFADSSSNAWNGTLSIYNWTGTIGSGGGTDQLRFGLNQNGLTSAQLAQIMFYSDAGTTSLGQGMLLGGGELVPVPEPSTIFCGAAMLGLIGWRERRRFFRKLPVES